MGEVNNSGYSQHLKLFKLSKCKQHSCVKKKRKYLNKWAGPDLVAHMLKGFSLHITIFQFSA